MNKEFEISTGVELINLMETESVKHNFGEPDEFKIKRWHD